LLSFRKFPVHDVIRTISVDSAPIFPYVVFSLYLSIYLSIYIYIYACILCSIISQKWTYSLVLSSGLKASFIHMTPVTVLNVFKIKSWFAFLDFSVLSWIKFPYYDIHRHVFVKCVGPILLLFLFNFIMPSGRLVKIIKR